MILGKDNIERLPPPVGTSDWATFSRDSHCVLEKLGNNCRHALPDEEFRKLLIILPPLPEQREIAAHIDAMVGRVNAIVEKRARGLMYVFRRFWMLPKKAISGSVSRFPVCNFSWASSRVQRMSAN